MRKLNRLEFIAVYAIVTNSANIGTTFFDMRIAAIGDVHACYEELELLYERLCWLSLDEIWHLGDLVDRGPHSGKTVEFCRENNIKGVLGNHDQSIINHWDRVVKGGHLPKNPDKRRTVSEVTQLDIDYLKKLPLLHIIDNLNLVLVHGGLYPTIPLYAQPPNVCRLQMIHPYELGKSRWWGKDAAVFGGKTEAQLTKELWRRWYEVYDHEQDVLFGHSTWSQPVIRQNDGAGRTIGIDTGSSFGGLLTACVMDDSKEPLFISIKNKKEYVKSTARIFIEG